jgi:hypothetical protein
MNDFLPEFPCGSGDPSRGVLVMPGSWWVILAAVASLGCVGGWLAARLVHSLWWSHRFARAVRQFHLQRERLEARFVKLGQSRVQPGSRRWIDCQFDNEVTYARNRLTGEISAFVGVTIEMEAPDTSPLFEAASSFRTGTAVFRYDGHRWETDGRVIYNLTPQEALYFYKGDLKPLTRETVRRS